MKKTFLFLILSLLITSPALAKKSARVEKDLARAQEKMDAGEYEAAEELYKKVLESVEKQEEALIGLGDSHYWQGEYLNAIKAYDKILKEHPNHVSALNKMGKTYLALGDETKARRYFEQAKKIDPKSEEAESLEGQVTRKSSIRLMGGFQNESLSYASDSKGEFQDASIEVERLFQIGIYNGYVHRFDKEGLNTLLYGYYYPLKDTRISAVAGSAGKISILPRQNYQIGLAQHIGQYRPEVTYLFQDFQEANTHNLTAALYVTPMPIVEIGGGYQFKSLKAGNNSGNFHGGFAKLKLGTPFQWLSFNALYEYNQNGFEPGRAPTPFVSYNSHLYGGGLSATASESLAFEAALFREDRNNAEDSMITKLSMGYAF